MVFIYEMQGEFSVRTLRYIIRPGGFNMWRRDIKVRQFIVTKNKVTKEKKIGQRLEIQVDIQARKLYLEFALMTLDSDETSRDFETGVLHRISSRVYLAEWFGLGSHFGRNACLGLISPNYNGHF